MAKMFVKKKPCKIKEYRKCYNNRGDNVGWSEFYPNETSMYHETRSKK